MRLTAAFDPCRFGDRLTCDYARSKDYLMALTNENAQLREIGRGKKPTVAMVCHLLSAASAQICQCPIHH